MGKNRPKSETSQRLDALLKGAFAGTPTQLKDIPKKRSPSKAPAKGAGGSKTPVKVRFD